VEKYLKALLQESGVAIPRTHDLEHLRPCQLLVKQFYGLCVEA
jgi:hypothetical protein